MESIDAVAFRIGDPKLIRRHYAPYILRSMNRVYRRLNTQLTCLEKVWSLDFSTLDPLVQYMSLPVDFIRPFRIEPFLTYREPGNMVLEDESFSEQEDTFTIMAGKIYISEIAADSLYSVWYYSSGYTLVDKADEDLLEGEINVPEWPREFGADLLFYATCIEISTDYPMYEHDYRMYIELKRELEKIGFNKQSVTPNIMGGWGRKNERDDGYGVY